MSLSGINDWILHSRTLHFTFEVLTAATILRTVKESPSGYDEPLLQQIAISLS